MVTARQYVALHLYYVEGWSHRRIAQVLGITHAPVQRLILRGRRWIMEAGCDQGGANSPYIEKLLCSSRTSSPTRDVGRAASRQDQLLMEWESRVEQRERELGDIDSLMRGNQGVPDSLHRTFIRDYYDDAWIVPYRRPSHQFDQWEMLYLNDRPGSRTIHTAAYDSHRAARYCAAPPTCSIHPRCVGCPHARLGAL